MFIVVGKGLKANMALDLSAKGPSRTATEDCPRAPRPELWFGA